ncbi:hypothetical protein [Alteromonas sp. KUL49]|uniref:hypothetical protein n=1 Tax=Alteromonas sp. KUL49 TaxID=2480798 RepID=UPI00102F08C7|nr:hypothetical protein [Alteromonas sp. KUL49]TAP38739.1 hypothetical protein EYS00_15160 [Alteromonas sp. KUL49]GEA12694.1 hypothetical protein KUL49_30690 [Alteromonas sp. KUL49]
MKKLIDLAHQQLVLLLKKLIVIVPLLFCTLMFLLPIIFYISKFGLGLWDDHQSWAELGSFFSGIYSPIIALIALIILGAQWRAQLNYSRYQTDVETIKMFRDNIDFYLSKLEEELKFIPKRDISMSEKLRNLNVQMTAEDLKTQFTIDSIKKLKQENRLVFDLWLSIIPELKGLNAIDSPIFSHALTASKLRLAVVLSHKVCVSLDMCTYSLMKNVKKEDLYFWGRDLDQKDWT